MVLYNQGQGKTKSKTKIKQKQGEQKMINQKTISALKRTEKTTISEQCNILLMASVEFEYLNIYSARTGCYININNIVFTNIPQIQCTHHSKFAKENSSNILDKDDGFIRFIFEIGNKAVLITMENEE